MKLKPGIGATASDVCQLGPDSHQRPKLILYSHLLLHLNRSAAILRAAVYTDPPTVSPHIAPSEAHHGSTTRGHATRGAVAVDPAGLSGAWAGDGETDTAVRHEQLTNYSTPHRP